MKKLFDNLIKYTFAILSVLVFAMNFILTLMTYKWWTVLVFPLALIIGMLMLCILVFLMSYLHESISKKQIVSPIKWFKTQIHKQC